MAKTDWDLDADLWEHDQACKYVCPEDPSDRARLDRLAKIAAHAKKLFWVPIRRRRPFPNGYAYRPPEFLAFAQSKGFKISPELAGRIASPRPAGWPWGEHETELLRHLAAAAKRFWKNYDPSDPTTAPTNDQVIDWLVEQGVPQRIAEVMATILRAGGLPSGRRKK